MKIVDIFLLCLDSILGISGILSCIFLLILFVKNMVSKRKIVKPLIFIILFGILMSIDITREISVIIFAGIVFLHGFFWLFYTIRQLFIRENPCFSEYEKYPDVAVLIPVKNEEVVLQETVESVLALDYPVEKLQVIVIDDNSTDNTVQILNKYHQNMQIRILTNQGAPGKAGALNYAIKNIAAEYFIILDADHHIQPNFIKVGLVHFNDKNVGCVQGRTIIRNKFKSIITILVDMDTLLNYEVLFAGKPCPNFTGSGAIFHSDIFRQVGFFCEESITEDMELSYKLYKHGVKTAYDRRLITTSLAPLKYMTLYKQRYRWFSGLIQIWFNNIIPILKSKSLRFSQKIDIFQNGLGVLTLKCMFILNLILCAKWFGFDLIQSYNLIRFILYFMLIVIVIGVFCAFIKVHRKIYLYFLGFFSPFVYLILYFPAVAIIINKYIFKKADRWFPTIRE